MKIFSKNNDITMKIAKGMVAIFTIKLILFGIIVLIQSCTQDNYIVDESIKNAEDVFLKSLTQTGENFYSVPVVTTKLENEVFHKSADISQSVMVKSLNESADIQLNDLADVSNGLIRGDIQLVLDPELIIEQEGNNLMQIQVPASDIKVALATSINASKNYLYTYGFSDSEIDEMLLGQDESLLIQLVHASITLQNENYVNANSINENDFINTLFGIQTAQAQRQITFEEVGRWAAAAIGLDIIQEMREQTAGKKITKRVLEKAFKKVTTKLASYLTGFGLAWTAVYFVGCLAFSY